jgi:hypothetical protein
VGGRARRAIHLPEPAAYGASSAPQVAAALRLAKEFVVGANLDPTVIAGGYPTTALAVVDPFSAVAMKAVTAGLAHPTRQDDPINLFSRFGPEVRLATDVVKVRGETTLSKGSLGGVRIDLDYSFAYALREASDHGSSPGITRTVVRRALSFQLADPTRFRQTPGTVDLTHTGSELDNSSCAADDGFLHPQFADGSAAAGSPTATPGGPTVDPYDRGKPVGAGRSDGDCANLTRT